MTREEIRQVVEATFDLERAIVSVTKPESVALPDDLLEILRG